MRKIVYGKTANVGIREHFKVALLDMETGKITGDYYSIAKGSENVPEMAGFIVKGFIRTVTPKDSHKQPFEAFHVLESFNADANMKVEGDKVTLTIPGFFSKTVPLESLYTNKNHTKHIEVIQRQGAVEISNQDYHKLIALAEKMRKEPDLWKDLTLVNSKKVSEKDHYILHSSEESVDPVGLVGTPQVFVRGTKQEVDDFLKKWNIDKKSIIYTRFSH